MTPEQCFQLLWSQAAAALALASQFPTASTDGVIAYAGRFAGEFELEGGACYSWNEGTPSIRFFRLHAALPVDRERPDPESAASDLCTLAHEYGHFLSDKEQARHAEARELYRDHKIANQDDADAILEEEIAAWRLGREQLERLGWPDFECFDAMRDERLGGYRRVLGEMMTKNRR